MTEDKPEESAANAMEVDIQHNNLTEEVGHSVGSAVETSVEEAAAANGDDRKSPTISVSPAKKQSNGPTSEEEAKIKDDEEAAVLEEVEQEDSAAAKSPDDEAKKDEPEPVKKAASPSKAVRAKPVENEKAVEKAEDEEGAPEAAIEETNESASHATKEEEKTPRKRGRQPSASPSKAATTPAVEPKEKESRSMAKRARAPVGRAAAGGGDEEQHAKTPLYESPLTVEGKRERKQVERLSMAVATPAEKKSDVPKGSGTKLGEIPYVEYMLEHYKGDDLKPLHRLIFHRNGSQHEIRKNIRQFNGFEFAIDTEEFNKKLKTIEGWNTAIVKKVAEILGLEGRSGKTKEALARDVMEYLITPSDSGKAVPKKKGKGKKKSGSKKSSKRKSDASGSGKKKKSEGGKKGKAAEAESNASSAEDEKSSSEDEKSSESSESEPEEEEPKAKKAKSPSVSPKKQVPAKAVAAATPKKEKAAATPKKEAASSSKSKKFPTDNELKQTVQAILKGADLEKVTMNTVCEQVYGKFPGCDLSTKKKFIKETVKAIIASAD